MCSTPLHSQLLCLPRMGLKCKGESNKGCGSPRATEGCVNSATMDGCEKQRRAQRATHWPHSAQYAGSVHFLPATSAQYAGAVVTRGTGAEDQRQCCDVPHTHAGPNSKGQQWTDDRQPVPYRGSACEENVGRTMLFFHPKYSGPRS